MADVFISYAREDRSRAEQVARALQAAGIQAFWDTEIPPGQTWADYIEGKLAQCKALIVLWSEHSTKSQWVREEARMGRDKGKLIPAMLDGSPAPFGFGEVQAANLSTWNGDPNHAEWLRMRAAVESALGRFGASAPPPPQAPPQNYAPPPPSSSFTSSMPPPVSMFVSNAGATGEKPWIYVQKCFRMFVNGTGRARRSEFWWFSLFFSVVIFIAMASDISTFPINQIEPSYLPITGLAYIVLCFPFVSVTARRLHDISLNGWLAALALIPWLGWLFAAVIGFIPGQPGDNKYGPNPKAA